MTSGVIKVPKWVKPLYQDNYTYYVYYGGRDSAKSYSIADFLIVQSMTHVDCTILCVRELQKSISASVHTLLSQRIRQLGLSHEFNITLTSIICKRTFTRFIFDGVRHNAENLKSIPNVKFLWIEEAASISAVSWIDLQPTILRNKGCKIICTLNPKNATDIIYRSFVLNEHHDSFVQKVTYRDNPFGITDKQLEALNALKTKDYALYLHVYEGELLTNSEAQVFKTPNHWIVDTFDDDPKAFKHFGLDFGFSQDPTAGIRCYIKDNTLYISHEAFKKGLEIDDTAQFLEQNLPDLRKYTIYADSANPALISYIKRNGYRIEAVKKGAGSVEDGIAYMKSFDKIVIHPRCENLIKEFTTHSYKVDERSGNISTIFVDADNHGIDAIRYALESMMRRSRVDYSGIKSWAIVA